MVILNFFLYWVTEDKVWVIIPVLQTEITVIWLCFHSHGIWAISDLKRLSDLQLMTESALADTRGAQVLGETCFLSG